MARMLNVTPDTVTGWELNRHEPPARLAKAIIAFLGFCPLAGKSPGKELKYARLITGKTQREVAELIGCDESNLRRIELDQRKPRPETLRRIRNFIPAARAVCQKNISKGINYFFICESCMLFPKDLDNFSCIQHGAILY